MVSSSRLIKRTSCPVCSSKQSSSLYQTSFSNEGIKSYISRSYGQSSRFNYDYFEGLYYSLLRCQNCNLIYQEYVPNSAFLSELYEEWIDSSQALLRHKTYSVDYYSIHSQDISQLLTYIDKPPSRIKELDFGMGWGAWALMAKAFGCTVYGIELSQQRIEHATSHGIHTIQWDDIPDYDFDLINTDQVFEHLVDPVSVIHQLQTSLTPGGLLKISVPNSFGMRYRLKHMDWSAPKGSRKSLNPVSPFEHVNCFYRQSMLKLAEGAGLLENKIPMHLQYTHTANWSSLRRALRNLLMPICRNVLGSQNYYIFRKPALERL